MFKTAMKLTTYYPLLGAVCLVGFMALSNYAQAAETAVVASQGLEGVLVTIIQQVQTGVSAGIHFLQAEIPDVIKQLLVWKLAEAVVIVVGLVVLQVALFLVSRKAWVWSTRAESDSDDMIVLIFTGLPTMIATPFIVGHAFKNVLLALQIYITPKMYLIEYAASLAK